LALSAANQRRHGAVGSAVARREPGGYACLVLGARFWLILSVPSKRVIGIRSPTIPRSMV